MSTDKNRKRGFYWVIAKEYGPPFRTIGLWRDSAWLFAEADGNEMGSSFEVLKVGKRILLSERDYKYVEVVHPELLKDVNGRTK